MTVCDIAVVGAGPAGATAAKLCAEVGFNTVLVAWPRTDPGRATQTISADRHRPDEIFALGIRAGVIPAVAISGFRSSWGESVHASDSTLRPEGLVVAIDRAASEAWLSSEAERAGARRIRARIVRCDPTGTGWALLATTGEQVAARAVIDASGRPSRVARRLGARLITVDHLVACSMCLTLPDGLATDRIVEVAAQPDGWFIALPQPDGVGLASYYSDGGASANALAIARDILQRRCRALGGEANGSIRASAAATQFLDCAAFEGLVAVGDAAQTQDPLSSSGVARAIEDARSGVAALVGALGGDASALAQHEMARREAILRYLKTRQAYYQIEGRWPERSFWESRASGADTRAALGRARWRQ